MRARRSTVAGGGPQGPRRPCRGGGAQPRLRTGCRHDQSVPSRRAAESAGGWRAQVRKRRGTRRRARKPVLAALSHDSRWRLATITVGRCLCQQGFARGCGPSNRSARTPYLTYTARCFAAGAPDLDMHADRAWSGSLASAWLRKPKGARHMQSDECSKGHAWSESACGLETQVRRESRTVAVGEAWALINHRRRMARGGETQGPGGELREHIEATTTWVVDQPPCPDPVPAAADQEKGALCVMPQLVGRNIVFQAPRRHRHFWQCRDLNAVRRIWFRMIRIGANPSGASWLAPQGDIDLPESPPRRRSSLDEKPACNIQRRPEFQARSSNQSRHVGNAAATGSRKW